MPPACPVCRSEDFAALYRFDPARTIPSEIVCCGRCHLLYKVPLPQARPVADYYDDSYANSPYWQQHAAADRASRRILHEITGALGAARGALLDIGCGAGDLLCSAKEAGFAATGVEMIPKLAQRARERAGAEVIEGDILGVDLGERRFDVITLLDLIEHLPDPLAALKRCRGWLRPGGHLVLYTPNHAGAIVRLARALHRLSGGRIAGPVVEIFDCTHLVFFDRCSLARALEAAGFGVERTASFAYDGARSQQASWLVARGLAAVELCAPLAGGRFRLLAIARLAPNPAS